MSKRESSVNENTIFVNGSDDALGSFFDIIDKRYAASGKDEQGEGYVFEWSEAFNISTNLIQAQPEDIGDKEKLLGLVEMFIKTLQSNHL